MTNRPDGALWYKDAIIYQLHVRSFYDSNDDGIGEFQGLIRKLDYLRDLGVTGLWLLPFYPSPLRDDGYDIADYTSINPAYGNLRDFREFLREAHRRGLKVITELVINHTSDKHEWFQRSRRAPPGDPWREFYVWSDDPKRYRDARIIFKDFETSNWSWDPVAKRYYWHRFYSHQPDLNFDNPRVRRSVLELLDFWLGMGVDGLRLDAVPYLIEREGTSCENLPETHAFLREVRAHVDSKFPNRMLLAEANQWPEDAIAYFGKGDECHMAFHFPLMPRLFMALKMEDRFSIIDILQQTPEIPETCQWATFLRNHDELTLEMVTDEERDYMYNVYATDPQARINLGIRRRLSPLLSNDRRQIQLLNALLFALPGTPVIYYGDELGMGDNIWLGDRNGVRTPFQWSPDRNAGFSRADPQRLFLPVIISPEYNYEAVNVETQQANMNSLLWWMKNLISIAKRHPALRRGRIEFLEPPNRKVLCFLRSFGDEVLLVIANLSRKAECVEIDLKRFNGQVPVELLGDVKFPPIGELPYFITLGPYGFYWFRLVSPAARDDRAAESRPTPLVETEGPLSWNELRGTLAQFLARARWFGSKTRAIVDLEIIDTAVLDASTLLFARTSYGEGASETYLIPMTIALEGDPERPRPDTPNATIAEYRRRDTAESGLICDATAYPDLCRRLLASVLRRRSIPTERGTIEAHLVLPGKKVAINSLPPPKPVGSEQTNSSFIIGGEFVLKLFRRQERGLNPDVELGTYLTRKGFPNAPPVIGHLTYDRVQQTSSIAVVNAFVPNEGDAWKMTTEHLRRFSEEAQVKALPEELGRQASVSPLELVADEPPPALREKAGYYFAQASLLGQRTAELHACLAAEEADPDFLPEPFTPFYQRSLYQSLRNSADRALKALRSAAAELAPSSPDRVIFDDVIRQESRVLKLFARIKDQSIDAVRIRCHGDYHLGQVLFTGKDFVILDFEGEPARSIGERRLKVSPLKDVAGLMRSMDYAAHYVLRGGNLREEDKQRVKPWLDVWTRWSQASFLKSYLDHSAEKGFLPGTFGANRDLLEIFLLDKALYEIFYELNTRPDWVSIPCKGILDLLKEGTR